MAKRKAKPKPPPLDLRHLTFTAEIPENRRVALSALRVLRNRARDWLIDEGGLGRNYLRAYAKEHAGKVAELRITLEPAKQAAPKWYGPLVINLDREGHEPHVMEGTLVVESPRGAFHIQQTERGLEVRASGMGFGSQLAVLPKSGNVIEIQFAQEDQV